MQTQNRYQSTVPNHPQSDLKTPTEVARDLKISPRTLQDWRSNGKGPKFVRVGKVIRYRDQDVEAWLKSQEGDGQS